MKSTQKTIAALAVFAMMFAGFGVFFAAEANDADDPVAPTKTFSIVFEGVYIDSTDEAIAYLVASAGAGNGNVLYIATLDDDFEEKITVLTKDYYDAMKAACTIKGDTVIFKMADGVVIPKDGAPAVDLDDALQGLIIFTSFEKSRTGVISGVSTEVELKNTLVTKNVTFDVVFEEDAEAAVTAAIALVKAAYEGYLSPEEAQAAIDEAVKAAVAAYADYKSPEEVQKAIDDAVEAYKEAHPQVVEKNDFYLYIAVVAIAAMIVFAILLVFFQIIKPRMAKKAKTPKTI